MPRLSRGRPPASDAPTATATPASRRPATARTTTPDSTTTPASAGGPDLPRYEPPTAPLNAAAQRALDALAADGHTAAAAATALARHQKEAAQQLAEAAGDAHERLTARRAALGQARRRAERARGGPEGDAAAEGAGTSTAEAEALESLGADVAELETAVQALADQLETGIRRNIEQQACAQAAGAALRELGARAARGGAPARMTQGSLGDSQFRPDEPMEDAPEDDDEDEDDADEDESEEEGEKDAEDAEGRPPRRPKKKPKRAARDEGPAPVSVLALLKEQAAQQAGAWAALPDRARYATHNDYINYRRSVHYAQHPDGQAPPVPHSRTWFPAEARSASPAGSAASSGAAAGAGGLPARTRRGGAAAAALAADPISSDADEDDQVEAVIERRSIKCPITLVPMRDPVSSAKCPHSFEREAIMGMIASSDFEVEGGPHGPERRKAIRCPVCEAVLTADVLRPDGALKRAVRRALAAEAADERARTGADDAPSNNDSLIEGQSRSVRNPGAASGPRPKKERVSDAGVDMDVDGADEEKAADGGAYVDLGDGEEEDLYN